MASVLEYVEELLVDVGPRPAGSEKEFQASEIIANRFEEFGLGTQVEEFDCYPFAPWMPLIGYALVIFGVLFSFFIPGAGIAGLIMVTLGLLIVVLEMLNLNPIHKIIPTKLSQNVIARYVPTGSINNDRPRKVIILAHYDSGRGMIEAIPSIGKQIKLLRLVLRIALVAAFITAILVLIPVLPELAMTIARYVMLGSAIIVAIALVVALVNQFQPVQNAANCNASGVAVLYNLAEKLATQGSMSSAAVPGTASRRRRRRSGAGESEPGLALQQTAGEPSAYQQTGQPPFTETTEGPAVGLDSRQASGELIPDGIGSGEVSITFNPEDTLSAMPSASQSVAGNLVQVGTERRSPFVFDRAPAAQAGSSKDAEPGEGDQPADSDTELQQSAELASAPAADPAVPDWYTKARQNAEKKNEQRSHREGTSEVVRSRYADIPMTLSEAPGKSTDNQTGTAGSAIFAAIDSESASFPVIPDIAEFSISTSISAEAPEASTDESAAAAESNQAGDSAATESGQVGEFDAAVSGQVGDFAASGAGQVGDFAAAGSERGEVIEATPAAQEGEFDAAEAALSAAPGTAASFAAAPNAATSYEAIPYATGSSPVPESFDNLRADVRPSERYRSSLPQPDLSGIDRQAFQVVSTADEAGSLILPTISETSKSSIPAQPELFEPETLDTFERLSRLPAVQPQSEQPAVGESEVPSTAEQSLDAEPASSLSTTRRATSSQAAADSASNQAAEPASSQATPWESEYYQAEAEPAGSQAAAEPASSQPSPWEPEYYQAAEPASDLVAAEPAGDQLSFEQPSPDQLAQDSSTENQQAQESSAESLKDRLNQRLQALPDLSPREKAAPAQQASIDEAYVPPEALFADENSLVSNTGSFIPLASTGITKPVGEELLLDRDPQDLYMQDADDNPSGSFADYTAEGTYSDPEMIQIQESGVRNFFDSLGERFGRGKRKRNLDDAPSTWLGVDENYEARKEGGSIGSWDNFNDDDSDLWDGGAYGGEDFAENIQAIEEVSNELLDKEVWLVALGSSELGHAGVRYFLKRHERQIKGSLFINLLGVGAGDLCFTILEGELIANRTDQRLQNLIQAAAQDIAAPLAPCAYTSFDTDCSVILKKTSRAISLIGMGDALPQYWRHKDDSISRLREEKIVTASELVLETIKNS